MRDLLRPTASYRQQIRVRLADRPSAFAELVTAIAQAGGSLGQIDLLARGNSETSRDVTFDAGSEEHAERIVAAARELPGVEIDEVIDRTLFLHRGGKLEVRSKVTLESAADLAMIYTPGVARACLAIAAEPSRVRELTSKRNTVAVVTDGSAVLGLGDIGPEAALPVMEGKAVLFKQFADIDAWPICLSVREIDEVVQTMIAIAPGFGGINLEDIAAPRCFEIERRLQAELEIPVFHDDQHGTAVVVLAALLNALKVVRKHLPAVKIVVVGIGSAGTAVTQLLLDAGAGNVIGCDRSGALYRGQPGLPTHRIAYTKTTNPTRERGSIAKVLKGADVVIGLSGPNAFTADDIGAMARDPIVFTLANPTPEIAPEQISDLAAVVATGRSDYPNQINNVLVFPGIFHGALDVEARSITNKMKLAASVAIAELVSPQELGPGYIIPSVFNRDVAHVVASAVASAA